MWSLRPAAIAGVRKIQHLADLRNMCAHVLDDEPSGTEVQELLDDVDGVLRALPTGPPRSSGQDDDERPVVRPR